MQTYAEKETISEQDVIMQGTVKSLQESTVELVGINSIVCAQGETISRIQGKINEAEVTLKRASRKLTHLLRKTKRKRMVSFCLLCLTTLGIFTLGAYTYKYA
ncbi:uncharacterized protein NEMAJ01_2243 [Nematocida major]|uniref:uncharacterized protein n=1 Tax=Nematocida major TaxID=1912982 RepID=UPI0020080299|nr:uncharacterized protein NEMAJ01_2225 [Nematocida major]XP_047772038.1 uncharacterized protein NEMAJ01_2243 [Nematocida major]KAH9387329.1 hypothetical protein NEMAJ01_2225 [Nematocida major]KAH9387347.1 hypothetical protein NEMAJ01_2243 [Nematocida major]